MCGKQKVGGWPGLGRTSRKGNQSSQEFLVTQKIPEVTVLFTTLPIHEAALQFPPFLPLADTRPRRVGLETPRSRRSRPAPPQRAASDAGFPLRPAGRFPRSLRLATEPSPPGTLLIGQTRRRRSASLSPGVRAQSSRLLRGAGQSCETPGEDGGEPSPAAGGGRPGRRRAPLRGRRHRG